MSEYTPNSQGRRFPRGGLQEEESLSWNSSAVVCVGQVRGVFVWDLKEVFSRVCLHFSESNDRRLKSWVDVVSFQRFCKFGAAVPQVELNRVGGLSVLISK